MIIDLSFFNKKKMLIKALIFTFLASLLSACYNGDTEDFLEAFDAAELDINAISIIALNTVIEEGQMQNYTVSATQNSGGTIDISNLVDFTVSDTSIATISSSGLLNGLASGVTTVTASFASFEDSIELEVSDRPLETISIDFAVDVFPSDASSTSIPVCTSGYQLIATGDYGTDAGGDDDLRDITSLVTWTSTASTIADVDDEFQLTSFGVGDATISASRSFPATDPAINSNNLLTTSTDTLVVDSISVSRENDATNTSMVIGDTRQYVAQASFNLADTVTLSITEGAAWSRSAEDSASLSDPNQEGQRGRVEALAVGNPDLIATCESESGSIAIDVIEAAVLTAIRIDDDNDDDDETTERVEKNVGDSDFQLYAFAIFSDGSEREITEDDDITWRVPSADQDVITVDDDDDNKGEVTVVGEGVGQVEILYEGEEDDIVIDVEE